ncbi:MAG: type 4a pilus biogenesis protein PilO [Candidatus Omnitrophica bacterium]|nr:type 4a pilus biogenesis protein PilO [Candidatus Omnitrophota bacterium]
MNLPTPLSKIFKARFSHRELVLWSIGLILFIVLFIQFFIIPAGHRALRLKKEIAVMKTRYQQLVAQEGSLEQTIISLQKELTSLEESLPHQEKISGILKALSEKASHLGIQVISIRPESAVPYPNATNPLLLGGRSCEALSIQMELRCSYRVLGGYLTSIEQAFPSAITIDGVNIQKEGGKSSTLKVTLFVTTYLFGNSP